MLIEATDIPVRYRYRDGREILFRLGSPIELPDAEAMRLLERAAGKVRRVGHARRDWLTAWRELAEVTHGLTPKDPRLRPVLAALDVCDTAFVADDWSAFHEARTGVLRAMNGLQPGNAARH